MTEDSYKRTVPGAWLFLLAAALPFVAWAAEIAPGQPVGELIDEYRREGIPFVYSSRLVPDSLLVETVPQQSDPVAIVAEILAPHGLVIRESDGYYVIVRQGRAEEQMPSRAAPTSAAGTPLLEEVTVSASRYEFERESGRSPLRISRDDLESLPDLGEDPVRAIHRLPGAAAGGTSARAHFRGGAKDETGILLNGHRLLDPFHIRDYHSLFSAIDTRAVASMEVYSGGFPARYGNRMSGLVLIDSLAPEKPRRTEIGLSVFNTSVLSAGRFGDDGRWLLSARRSNLHLVLNSDLGEPRYHDLFVELSQRLTPRTTFSVNGFFADDAVLVATESDVEERENSRNDASNAQAWLQFETAWTGSLDSTTAFATATLQDDRKGENDQPDKIIGSVSDRRDVDIWELRQDWGWRLGERHFLSWGGQYQKIRADYRYRAQAKYLDFYRAFASVPQIVNRDLRAHVDGAAYSLFVSDRWRVTDQLAAEVGLRWDRQTYTTSPADEQWSPRITLFRKLGKRSELRLSAGRYYQPQAPHELQIEDGITRFFPAQRADHYIVGLQHSYPSGLSFRVELYDKLMRGLSPRFENLYSPLAIIPELEPDRVRIEPDSARSRGVEFSVTSEPGDGVGWWANYVLARVEDRFDGRDVPRSWDQRHSFQAGFAWRREGWEFGAALRLHSGWPTTRLLLDPESTIDEPLVRFGERNAGRFGSYASLDLRLSRRFRMAVGSLSAFVEISNLTDRKNPCCADHDLEEAGNSLVLVRSEEHWLPRLPAVGILWEF